MSDLKIITLTDEEKKFIKFVLSDFVNIVDTNDDDTLNLEFLDWVKTNSTNILRRNYNG